jgi:hypothetical protein
MRPLIAVPVPLLEGNAPRRTLFACDSHHIQQFPVLTNCIYVRVASHNLQVRLLLRRTQTMKLLVQRHTRVKRPASLLEWNRWFAWYPVPIVTDGKLHYAWLHTVERKWGTSRYSGTIKWRYRLPGSRSRKRF